MIGLFDLPLALAHIFFGLSKGAYTNRNKLLFPLYIQHQIDQLSRLVFFQHLCKVIPLTCRSIEGKTRRAHTKQEIRMTVQNMEDPRPRW